MGAGYSPRHETKHEIGPKRSVCIEAVVRRCAQPWCNRTRLQNPPSVPSVGRGTKSHARAAMTSSLKLPPARSRIGAIGLRVGALALLFYGASFYTRDWRSIVPDVGQPSQAQAAAARPKAARPLAAPERSEPATWIEPLTTAALFKVTETVPSPAATETITRSPVSAPARVTTQPKARPAASRSPARHQRNEPPQVAAPSKVSQSSPVAVAPAAFEMPAQFRLAERGN